MNLPPCIRVVARMNTNTELQRFTMAGGPLPSSFRVLDCHKQARHQTAGACRKLPQSGCFFLNECERRALTITLLPPSLL